MDTKLDESPFLVSWRECVQAWSDERFLTKEELDALFLFATHIVNLGDAAGWEYAGHSYKRATPLGVLTVRAVLDESCVVAFISGRTFLNCVKILLRRIREDTMEWRVDKYRS